MGAFVGKGKLVRTLKEIGWVGTICYACDRLLRHLNWGRVHYYGFFTQPLKNGLRTVSGYACKIVDEPQALASCLGLPEDVVQSRVREGALCIALYHHDAVAGSLFAAFQPFEEDEVMARFHWVPAGLACWDFGVHIVPNARLTRAFSALWAGSAEILRGKGACWSLSRISLYNRASVQSHQALGALDMGRAVFIILGRMQITLSTQKPWLNICWSVKGRPTFTFQLPERQKS